MPGMEGQQENARGPGEQLREGQDQKELTCCRCSGRRCRKAAGTARVIFFKHAVSAARMAREHDIISWSWEAATRGGTGWQNGAQTQQLQASDQQVWVCNIPEMPRGFPGEALPLSGRMPSTRETGGAEDLRTQQPTGCEREEKHSLLFYALFLWPHFCSLFWETLFCYHFQGQEARSSWRP